MFCSVCGVESQGEFCTNCGARAGAAAAPGAPSAVPGQAPFTGAVPPSPQPQAGGLPTPRPMSMPMPMQQPGGYAVPSVDIGLRIGAVAIDVIPMLVVGLVIGWIPIIGFMAMGLIGTAYWLLRDFNGASLGKMALGLLVVRKDGTPSDMKDRILRNVTLAVGSALMIIPFAGYVLGPPVSAIMGITEIVMLIVKHERLGDMLANTTVVKKLG